MKTAIIISLLLTGCATNGPNTFVTSKYPIRPVIDNGPESEIAPDLIACNNLAKQVASSTDNALTGAIGGALLGGLFAAAMSSKEHTRELSQTGALTGLLKGGSTDDRKGIVARCMAGRGYRVLG
jgi:outer membrane lipoprotein SlyB